MNSENIIRKIIIILLVFLPILYNPLGFDVFALPRVFFLYIMCAILAVILVYKTAKDRKIEIKYTKLHLIFGVFLFFILFSMLFANDKYVSVWGYVWDYEGIISWICYAFLFYTGYLYFRSAENLKKIFRPLSYAAFFVGLYSFLQYFGNLELMQWMQKTEIKRASSFLGHPSYLGIYCILLLPLIFVLITEEKKSKYWKAFFTASLILLLASLYLSFSRGAWIAFVGVILMFAILRRKEIIFKIRNIVNRKTAVALFFLVAIFVLYAADKIGFLSLFAQRVISIFDKNSSSFIVRGYLYKQSFSLLRDNWMFGIGADNFAYAIPRYFLPSWNIFKTTVADKAHNQILDYWISFGIGGVLSYSVFLFYWLKKAIGSLKNTLGTEKYFLQAILFSVIGYIIAVQFHYSTIDLAPIFFFLLGCGAGIMADKKVMEEKKIIAADDGCRYWSNIRNFFYLSSSVLIVFVVYFASQNISADYLFTNSLKSKNLENSVFLAESAIEKNKHRVNYYLALNSFYIQKSDYDKNPYHLQKAIDSLIGAVKIMPCDYKLFYQLGETYLQSAKSAKNKDYVYHQAKIAYEETLKLYPNSVESYLKLGVVNAHLEKENEAIENWQKCAELEKTEEQCYYNLYILHNKRGEQELAKKNFEEYLELEGGK